MLLFANGLLVDKIRYPLVSERASLHLGAASLGQLRAAAPVPIGYSIAGMASVLPERDDRHVIGRCCFEEQAQRFKKPDLARDRSIVAE